MNFKHKILAAGLAAIIAGFGMFAANISTAQAQTDNDNANSAIAQMVQMIETLKQQIQQIIALIAQLKPQETCGNGKCRFGETATTCPADCQAIDNCVQEGKWGQRNQKCCQGLTANHRPAVSSGSIDAQGLFICYKCGDGICSENEMTDFCAKDCLKCGNGTCEDKEDQLSCAADCGTAKCALPYWPCWTSSITNPYGTTLTPNQCCEGTTCVMGVISGTCLPKDNNKCGNGVCDLEESVANCPADCNDCVIGFKASECCGCPKKISRSLVGTDGWVAYEKGKDYSAFPKKENCAGIACSPCEDINTIYQNNCALCGNSTCETGETATTCPADCVATENKTCSDLCKFKGYTASRCNMWSTGAMNTDPNAGCRAGELNLGWTSDCAPALGGTGGRACCCETKAPITIITPEICLKPLGSTITTAQKEACTKANGQIICSNQCNYTTSADVNYLLGTSGLATQSELPGTCPVVTSCYCACGQSGNNNGNVQTATEGPSWEGAIPAIDIKNLGANLSQAIETVKSILDKLILQK